MMNIRKLYVDGLESHCSYLESVSDLKQLTRSIRRANEDTAYVDGMEDWKDALAKIKDVTFPMAKKMAGSAWNLTKFASKEGLNLTSKAVNAANLQITKLTANNKYFIKEILRQLPDEGTFDITFTKLSSISTDGTLDDFVHDINEYKTVVNALNKHSDNILSYMDELIRLASRVNKNTTTKEAMSLLGVFDDLTYPKLSLGSHLLPGGRTIKYSANEDGVKYSMLTDKPSATSETKQFSKDDVKSVLNKLIELNETLLLIKKGQDRFIASVKAWNEMLPKVMTALVENTTLGSSTKREIKSKLTFEVGVLSFYGELYPELGACVNAYIIDLGGNFAKII